MKKILAVLLALIIIPLSMQTYNADESSETAPQSESSTESAEQTSEPDEQKRLVALGDSITRGYGLAEDEKSYVEILTEEGNFKSNNFAVNGRTSTVLLEDLQKPSEKERSALEQANYIVISIGGNDMLYLLNKLVNGALPSDSTENPVETVNNLIDMAEKLTPEPTPVQSKTTATATRTTVAINLQCSLHHSAADCTPSQMCSITLFSHSGFR